MPHSQISQASQPICLKRVVSVITLMKPSVQLDLTTRNEITDHLDRSHVISQDIRIILMDCPSALNLSVKPE